jgi:hypothetical protein
MTVAVTGRKLGQAQAVADRIEAHGLGIDRHCIAENDMIRQVAVVEIYGHWLNPAAVRTVKATTAAAIVAGPEGFKRTIARPLSGNWCPGEDSNFHDISATGT